jgi:hypothetical protein
VGGVEQFPNINKLCNVKSPNNKRKWQMGFNSAFKGLNSRHVCTVEQGVLKSAKNLIS